MGSYAWLNDGAQHLIAEFTFDALWISLNKDLRCHCVKNPADDPNPACMDCLGTGHQIKVREVELVSQNSTAQFRSKGSMIKNESVNLPKFFVDGKWPVQVDDLVAFGGHAYVINTSDDKKCNDGTVAYYLCGGAPKKANQAIFLANLRRITGGL